MLPHERLISTMPKMNLEMTTTTMMLMMSLETFFRGQINALSAATQKYQIPGCRFVTRLRTCRRGSWANPRDSWTARKTPGGWRRTRWPESLAGCGSRSWWSCWCHLECSWCTIPVDARWDKLWNVCARVSKQWNICTWVEQSYYIEVVIKVLERWKKKTTQMTTTTMMMVRW